MRRNGRRAILLHFGRDGFDNIDIEIGCLECEFAARGADEHIGENGNGVAPLNHAVHVSEGLEQRGLFNRNLHEGLFRRNLSKNGPPEPARREPLAEDDGRSARKSQAGGAHCRVHSQQKP
jgi:hypothetical protein